MTKTSISSRLPMNGYVHIDWFTVQGPCHHALLGRKHYRADSELGIVPSGAFGLTFPLRPGGGTLTVTSRQPCGGHYAGCLEISCCPTKALQRHNVFGHGALIAYVTEIFERVIQRLGIEVTQEEREQWRKGLVWLTEVHLTANFRCPRELIVPIIGAIDRIVSEGKSRELKTWIALGSSARGRSKHHRLGIYDKVLQLSKEDWPNPGPIQQRILDYISDAIRAELKIFVSGLKFRDLQYVANWNDLDVAALFFELLGGYNIQHAIQANPSDTLLKSLTRAEQKVYKAWMGGESLESQFKSRSSVKKYRDAFKSKIKVGDGDGNQSEAESLIDTRSIFCPESVVPVPDWLLGTDMFWQEPQEMVARAYRGIGSIRLPANLPPDQIVEVDGEMRVI